jgi:hypothetical protein
MKRASGVCAAGGAVALVLALRTSIEPVATFVTKALLNPSAAHWFAPYYGFLFVTLTALAGALLGLALLAACARIGASWVAAAVVVAAAGGFGARAAPWLGYAAPIAVLSFGALVAPGSFEARKSVATAHDALACVAIEGACLALGFWFPIARDIPALLVLLMAVAAAAFVIVAAGMRPDRRWRLVSAGLPALLLPWEGLRRNPTFWPLAAALVLGVGLARVASPRGRIDRFARQNALVLSLVALGAFFVLPWAFRDMPIADMAGHEGQHLGWLNSMSFGKLMMADAGFTYGPAREYGLEFIAWALGGVTLDHVRLAHVVLNMLGLLTLVIAAARVCGRQLGLLFMGLLLLLAHSSLVTFVVYGASYAFGWADALRAGLTTLSIVVTFSRRLFWGGLLAGLGLLYSHDFAVPGILATVACFGLALVVRGRVRWTAARALGRELRTYAVGIAVALAPALVFYALHGRLGAFFAGYAWTVRIFAGLPWGGDPKPVSFDSFKSCAALLAPPHYENAVGARVLEDFVCPALAILGFVHGAVAIAEKRFGRRSVIIVALSIVTTMTLRHAYLVEDAWHMLSAQTPALVLFVALAAGARRVPLGGIAAMIVPAFWLWAGSAIPFNTRLVRIAAGDERPSFGAPYHYDDVPRAGDENVTTQHLDPVRYIRTHTKPDDAVYISTGSIGGGTESFLSERRNPTSFDKNDEIATPELRARAVHELTSDPPVLVVGDDFQNLGDEGATFVRTHYRSTRVGLVTVWVRR